MFPGKEIQVSIVPHLIAYLPGYIGSPPGCVFLQERCRGDVIGFNDLIAFHQAVLGGKNVGYIIVLLGVVVGLAKEGTGVKHISWPGLAALAATAADKPGSHNRAGHPPITSAKKQNKLVEYLYISQWVRYSGFFKTTSAEVAGVAFTAGWALAFVAGVGESQRTHRALFNAQ